MRHRPPMEAGSAQCAISCAMVVCALLFPGSSLAAEDSSEYLGPHMPYAKFATLPISTIDVAGARLEIAVGPGDLGQRRETMFEWAADSAQAVAAYLGRFPVERLRILVVPVPGDDLDGTTWGYQGAATRIALGRSVSDADLVHSWVLAHEMVHVALPQIPDEQAWLEEGLATYVEPIARAQAGLLLEEDVWRQLVRGLPQGLPEQGDEGLDHTHSWGRTYWGGALFCLLADVEIRTRTQNRRGLQDALRAIVAAGGNNEADWTLRRVLDVGDEATGVRVLNGLYDRMKATPVDVDLDELWKRLGVAVKDGSVIFDDAAPLAGIRRAITMSPSANR